MRRFPGGPIYQTKCSEFGVRLRFFLSSDFTLYGIVSSQVYENTTGCVRCSLWSYG